MDTDERERIREITEKEKDAIMTDPARRKAVAEEFEKLVLTIPVPAMISRQIAAEGVTPIIVVTDEPDKYPDDYKWAEGVTVRHRSELMDVQRESFVRGMMARCEHGVLDFEQCPKCRGWE